MIIKKFKRMKLTRGNESLTCGVVIVKLGSASKGLHN